MAGQTQHDLYLPHGTDWKLWLCAADLLHAQVLLSDTRLGCPVCALYILLHLEPALQYCMTFAASNSRATS